MNAAARMVRRSVDERTAVCAALEMPLDVRAVGAVETPVDQVDEGFVEIRAVHMTSFVRTLSPCARYERIRIRALCTCDFDVPSEMPSIVPDLLVPEAFDVVQQERGPARRRQRIDGALQVDPADRAKYRHRRRHRRRVRLIQRVGLLAHPRLTVAEHVEAVVHRQPIQPGAERRFAAEAAELSIRQQEDVLQEIVGLAVGAHHPARQIVEPGGVLPVQRLESGSVSRSDAPDQFQVGAFHVTCRVRRGHVRGG